MNDEALLRYSRHIMLDEIDIEGQQRLLDAHVLIVGAGGLGSPAALYLASAGVGRLSIADDDHVELSNLQRQIAHTQASLGESKAHSACAAARALNPDCEAVPLTARLSGETLAAAVAEADLVLDCTDRFSSRFAINRACVASRTPLISGAAIRFSGQLAVFDQADDSPCYACLYGEQGDDEALSCAESGVIAPLVGVIGSFQALEALKWLSGAGRPHRGLSTFDALNGEWRHFALPRDPACPVCGPR
ncbi:molybdopterin-synthase adenylyltransferase MoeB [Salinicola endophyticus]|uniref:Molybdopterin-synthase adenylyltransferase MoeB n=1 Tax=Salinicola endophyticus TaxID=1949083 RepID=A0ABY8FKX9_9GAMM|nr:molybdopterin-synthase adenylyltransferase MoeB [Salinicola endophyticus]WFF42700.1 molybdopterin-synthase adenylyltransferase MoeB [Salinicola endophyticus]